MRSRRLPLFVALSFALLFAAPAVAATDVTTATKDVSIVVPARLLLSVNSGTATITDDPADTGTQNVASLAAQLTIKSNYGSTTLTVQSTTPTDGTNTIPISAFHYQVNGNVTNGLSSTSSVQSGATWAAFSNTAVNALAITGATDGTLVNYDYEADRSWSFPASTYTATVTYTISGV